MSNDYFLNFCGHFDRDRGLDQGRLRLDSLTRGNIEVWIAASSISTKQGFESFHQRGGYLPPDYRCKPKVQWSVRLNPIPMPTTKGVEGNFYQLLPTHVETDKGGKRSDFGIHLDANVPGSMGCIVMNGTRFRSFENQMELLRAKGILEIPLYATYS